MKSMEVCMILAKTLETIISLPLVMSVNICNMNENLLVVIEKDQPPQSILVPKKNLQHAYEILSKEGYDIYSHSEECIPMTDKRIQDI